MKDQENEKITTQQKEFPVDFYEEFTDDGRTYYSLEDLDNFNSMLMCESKKGILILSQKGSGKTTFMRRFVQQDLSKALGIDSVKVIHIFDEFINQYQKEEEVETKLIELCMNYENSAVILYLKANNENVLKAIIQFFKRNADRIKKQCNNTYLKLIIEYNVEDIKEREKLETLDFEGFWLYDIELPYEFEKRMKIYKLMTKELSKIYKVTISKKEFYFASIVIWGSLNKSINLKRFYDYMEFLYAFARRKNKKCISESIIRQAFPKEFETIQKRGAKELLRTAYHESGHALFCMINSNYRSLDVVTIIPTEKYVGVTRHSRSEEASQYLKDRTAFIYEIAGLIAGRVAESLIISPYTPHKGSFNDLCIVRDLADELIYEFGISSSIGNNTVMKRDEPISDSLKSHIEMERQKIIDEATKVASEQVTIHKKFIEQLANKMMEKLYVTGNETRKMWKEHLQELSKT